MSNDLKTTKRKWIFLSLFLIGVFLIGIGLTYVYLKPKPPKQWTLLYFEEGKGRYDGEKFTMDGEWMLEWDLEHTLGLSISWGYFVDEWGDGVWSDGWGFMPEDEGYEDKRRGRKEFPANKYCIVIHDYDHWIEKSDWLLKFYKIRGENTT